MSFPSLEKQLKVTKKRQIQQKRISEGKTTTFLEKVRNVVRFFLTLAMIVLSILALFCILHPPVREVMLQELNLALEGIFKSKTM